MEAVTLSWQLVQGLSTNAHDFWPALKGFISMAFHHKLLKLTDTQAPMLMAAMKQVVRNRPFDFGMDEYGDLHFQHTFYVIYANVVVLCVCFIDCH